ncbi:alpha/beta fold hydrolase [Pseudomonas frederiksbergensis]|uniref:Alpha/beta hydrolase n=1 Tax=Pseudomonas frederiksbergensis TaxID=104087 RepID=A0A423KR56_9PSED|nr:alpha/beta hydrolase [Pseudomonas frederiksbergensis]RON57840.1 alpha/beta hydrolase [Pseudomonas frederiksbergensis]
MNSEWQQPEQVGTEFFNRADFWGTFRHASARVGEVNLHYVEGGTGAPILLIPGWPQSWYAWRYVMPKLVAAGRRVIALDPRGMGESDAPPGSYDMRTVAAEIHAFAETIGLLDNGPIDVAGHDVGTWIGYALAADWRTDIRRLAVLDALIPGLSTPRTDLSHTEANLRTWHFAFNQLDGLPELLIAGREQVFLTWLLRAKSIQSWTVTPDDIAVYARQLAAPGALRAASSYYQSALSPEGLAASRQRAQVPLDIPVLALGAERGVGDNIVNALRAVAGNVKGGVIENAGHYLPEEAANRVAQELLAFFGE